MKYFAVFQNGNRKEYSKSATNTGFISSTVQMYLGIDELMDKITDGVYNGKSDEFTLLDQEFIELILSISKFDRKK